MKSKSIFVIAVLLPNVIDHIVTLLGQPSEYWQNYAKSNEAALITLLGHGPIIFIIGSIVYISILAFLLFKLPSKYSLPLGIFAFVGHAWGSASWIPGILYSHNINANEWVVSLVYFLVLSIFLSLGIGKWAGDSFKEI